MVTAFGVSLLVSVPLLVFGVRIMTIPRNQKFLGIRRCGNMGQGTEIRDSFMLSWSDGLVRRKLDAGAPRSCFWGRVNTFQGKGVKTFYHYKDRVDLDGLIRGNGMDGRHKAFAKELKCFFFSSWLLVWKGSNWSCIHRHVRAQTVRGVDFCMHEHGTEREGCLLSYFGRLRKLLGTTWNGTREAWCLRRSSSLRDMMSQRPTNTPY